jgi:hypothetical protein
VTARSRQSPPPHGTEMARGEVGREDRLPPGAIADLACTTKFVLRDHCFHAQAAGAGSGQGTARSRGLTES